jgi:acetylornithine deacetylase/succinyl-diaminopimelate desuccinylase-like protein
MNDTGAESPRRTRRTLRRSNWVRIFLVSVSFVSSVVDRRVLYAQNPDWGAVADEATRILQDYVRIDTSNPPGDTRKAADFFAGILEREGVPVTRYESAPGKAIVLARLKATASPPAGKPILLLQHFDVVPADRTQWKTDPFSATIQDDALWGRGAFDMKGLGVSHLMAFLLLKRQHVPLSRDVILLAEPDEESGGAQGARWMIANHYADLDPEYVLDEGGFGSADLLSPGKLVYGIATAEKKIVWLKVRAEGTAGHGSQPHDQNPNDRLLRALDRLLADQPPAPVATKFASAIKRSTVSVTWIRSGVGEPPKINVIPSVAEAGLDCRVMPGTSGDQWIAEVKRRLADPSLAIEVINQSDDPIVSPHDTPLYRNLESAIRRLHPDAAVTPILIPYGTDSNAFRPRGAKSYGIFPAVIPAAVVSQMHGDAERVPLAAVRESIQVFFEALRDTLAK